MASGRPLRDSLDGETVKFSIVTISYNQGTYLPDCIRSVAQQRESGVDIEHIVVDAGSTDGSVSYLESARDLLDKLIVEPDQGPADGLNKGFAHASGDVFGFINADDMLEPGALRAVATQMGREERPDVLTGGLRVLRESNGLAKERITLPRPFSLERYLAGAAVILQQSTFFTREAWDSVAGFNQSNRTCWDAEFFVDIALQGADFGRIRQVLAVFRIHPLSITGGDGNESEYERDLMRLHEKVKDAGVVPPTLVRAGLMRLGARLDPIRRLQEFTELTSARSGK